jgi:hypothetical protein
MSTMASNSQEQAATLKQAWLDEARQNGEAGPRLIKRRQTRYPWSAPLEVRAAGPGGQVRTYLATARDICVTGLQFHCRHDIGLYTQAEVCLAGESVGVPVVIRHQTQTISGFLIGAEFCN